MLQSVNTICVVGAGTMGSGIALNFAQNGFSTLLFDVNISVLEKSKLTIRNNLQYLVEKHKVLEEDADKICKKIRFISELNNCIADVIVEAIIENIDAKVAIFNQLAELNQEEVIFATNTSSISVTAIQARVKHPGRVIGMHFFNPAQVMRLVEVVKGDHTDIEVVNLIFDLCLKLNKIPVMCKDSPGFIVNRVGRQFYLESLKLLETGIATIETIDKTMEASGYKMGPFRLIDLIGMDINLAVSQSLFISFGKKERFRPSVLQIDKVAQGNLGKKSGSGFYNYKQ